MKKTRKFKYILGVLGIIIALFIYIYITKWEIINKVDVTQGIGQRSLEVRDGFAYHISGKALVILNISNPTNVEKVGIFSSQVRLNDIALYKDFAILASLDSGLLIINISNPEEPELVGKYPETGDASFSDILIHDDFAFVSDPTEKPSSIGQRIIILDITNPAQIIEISRVSNGGKPLVVHGNYLYAKGYHIEDPSIVDWLNIIDISNIRESKLVLYLDSFGRVLDAGVQDHYLYIGTPNDIVVTDISNPINPIEIDRIKVVAYQLIIQDDFIYYMGFKRVGMVNITNAGKLGSIQINREVHYATDMAYSMNYVYFVGGLPNLLYIFEGGGK